MTCIHDLNTRQGFDEALRMNGPALGRNTRALMGQSEATLMQADEAFRDGKPR